MVLYLVCYDLAASRQEQFEQIYSWVAYLHSLLPSQAEIKDKLKVIVVGTCSDLQQEGFELNNTELFQLIFSSLPFCNHIFRISILDPLSISTLFTVIAQECSSIMDRHSIKVLTEYRYLLDIIRSIPSPTHILHKSIILEHYTTERWKDGKTTVEGGLSFLHSIGEIVMFGDESICVDPSAISKIMAKFIAPPTVRKDILLNAPHSQKGQVILSQRQISSVLGFEMLRYYSFKV